MTVFLSVVWYNACQSLFSLFIWGAIPVTMATQLERNPPYPVLLQVSLEEVSLWSEFVTAGWRDPNPVPNLRFRVGGSSWRGHDNISNEFTGIWLSRKVEHTLMPDFCSALSILLNIQKTFNLSVLTSRYSIHAYSKLSFTFH